MSSPPTPSAPKPSTVLTYTVGPPSPDDSAKWRELYRAYADFYREAVTEAQLDLMWSWVTDPDHDVSALLVRDPSGTVVGLGHYRPYYRPLAATVAGHLDDLFVVPAARGTGAVDALMEALREIARQRGWSKIRWITADDNYRARSKYDQVAERTTWVTYDMQVPPAAT
jgi:ribosomal protein S18 acetylase RimI-like enzyme